MILDNYFLYSQIEKRNNHTDMNQILKKVTSKMSAFSPLVTSRFLKEQMNLPNFSQKFKILDATWDFPHTNRNPKQEHYDKRIPGATFFDIDECSDHNTSLPHMLPNTKQLERYVTQLGVTNKDHIIVYDNDSRFGLFTATRVWWMFRVFGHEMVSVLDGGLPKWIKDEFPIESGEFAAEEIIKGQYQRDAFKANFQPELIKDIHFMKKNLESDKMVQVVDARPSGRFKGLSPEPRSEVPSGHMPRSFNVPFMDCLTPETKVLKSPDELRALFLERGINVDGELIATCGSGVSATVVAFAAYLCSGQAVPVYDGSWTEWATLVKDKIVTEN